MDAKQTTKKGPSTIGAATIGAVVGAAGAAGVAYAMQHPKVRKVVSDMRDKAMQELKVRLDSQTKIIKKKVAPLLDSSENTKLSKRILDETTSSKGHKKAS